MTHQVSHSYDHTASQIYQQLEELPLRKYIEVSTFFRIMGSVENKQVLDLACGNGTYTRRLRQRGASRVVGVDVSKPMLHLAHHYEDENPLGIKYILKDVAEMGIVGHVDIVCAVQLFHYAKSVELFNAICKNIYDNLKPGGRFVSVGFSPFAHPGAPSMRKYGIELQVDESVQDGDLITGKIFLEDTDEPTLEITHHYWNHRTYERCLRTAGLKEIAWHLPEVSDEGIEIYGDSFWEDFLNNPFFIGLTCVRPW